MIAYYTHYYKDELGLIDYKERVTRRLQEEVNTESNISKLQALFPFFCYPVNYQKILVLGGGTGGEFITFSQRGYDAYTIEPNEEAAQIIKMKCAYYGFDENKISTAMAERLPYADNFFDMVWSWTVLEHVKDIERSIKELCRVLKPGGWAFLSMPDMRQFWEGHYKLTLPMFLPKFLLKLLLRLKNRPTQFIDYGINKITTRRVRNILQHLNVDSMLLFHPWSKEWLDNRTFGMNLIYWTTVLVGIPHNQFWFLRKRES